MPYITIEMEKGGGYASPIKLGELLKVYRNRGKTDHPNRPRTPLTLWTIDVAIAKSKMTFPGQKPIRITIVKNSLFNG